MNLVVTVVSGATMAADAEALARVSLLGSAIAERGCTLVVASRAALSRAAAAGARAAGGRVIDIPSVEPIPRGGGASVAPVSAPGGGVGAADAEDEAIRRADIVVIVGGRSGPPGNLAKAYADRRPIGVLTQSRGVASAVEALVRACARPSAGPVVCDDEPNRLVDRLIECHDRAAPPSEAAPADVPPSLRQLPVEPSV